MKPGLSFCVACVCLLPVLARTESVWDSANDPDSQSPFRQRVGLSYRMTYNVSAKFKNLGGLAARSNPGPATGSAVNRNYDDGFNRVDVSGNAGGQTWNWGYNNANQIVGNTVVMSSRSSAAIGESEASGDPQHGMEVTYNLELGRKKHWKWGLEAGANYTKVTIGDSRSLVGGVTTITDAFSLNGITPPMAPYSGTFNGPGAVIGSTPDRHVTTSANGADVTGHRELNADLFGARFGPYVEIPITDHVGLCFSGGLAMVDVRSEFSFDERVTIPGTGTATRSGNNSDDSILAGGYVSGSILFNITTRFSFFSSVQYVDVGDHNQQANGKSAELDLSKSVVLAIGGTFSF